MDFPNHGDLLEEVVLEAELQEEALLVQAIDVVKSLKVMVVAGDGGNERGYEVVQHRLQPPR